jgi:hypothetical protein
MEKPEWYPVVVLERTKRLSGPIPACTASRGPRDQAMSHLWLAPSLAALTPVLHGHGLEIPMAFWSATRAKGTSQGSHASIPMGARCGSDPTPNPRTPGHVTACEAAETVTREPDEKNFFSCERSINLTRAFLWVPHNQWRHRRLRICGAAVPAAGWVGGNSEFRIPSSGSGSGS